jgi:osmoprotectant transport system ATP-binding protein
VRSSESERRPTVIVFEDVTHEYEHVVAVREVTLRVGNAATTALIGPSGCGKSTLLKLVAGLAWPQRGRVRIDEQVVAPANIERIRHRIGYVIQSGGLFPHLTTRDNVTLAARYLKRDKDWIDVRLRELSELVQLPPEILARFPGDLSGGQRQRVSLMRALMLDPDLLLLDEPLGALDPMVRHGLQDELRSLFARLKKSVLLVTHDLAEAAFFADTIVLMREGRVVQQGSYRDLTEAPADDFVRAFLKAQRALAVPASNA